MSINHILGTSIASAISKPKVDGKEEKSEAPKSANLERAVVTKSAGLGQTIGTPKLSEKATEYYNKLKEKFHNMDFILVSSDKKQAAQANAASYGNASKMVVLIDEEKLERMAEDSAYRAKYEGIIGNASANLSQLSSKIGSTGANVSGFGVQVHEDGTTSYFAVLKNSSDAQKQRIEKGREKKAAEKKVEAKKAEKKAEAKRAEKKRTESERAERFEEKKVDADKDQVKITANSMEELVQKIQDQYQIWQTDVVKTKEEWAIGQHIDFVG